MQAWQIEEARRTAEEAVAAQRDLEGQLQTLRETREQAINDAHSAFTVSIGDGALKQESDRQEAEADAAAAAAAAAAEAAASDAAREYPGIYHFNKLFIRVGFYVSCVTCNLFHIMNLLISIQFQGEKYKRTEYVDLKCEFNSDTAAQKMPGVEEPDSALTSFLWISAVANVLFAVAVIVERNSSCAHCSFLVSLIVNMLCQIGALVRTAHKSPFTYTLSVSVVSILAALVCLFGIYRHDLSKKKAVSLAGDATAEQTALKSLSDDGALAEALNNCLVKLHLRITLLFGYVSMVVWVAYIYAPDYCSRANFPDWGLITLGLILLLVFVMSCRIRTYSLLDWESGHKKVWGHTLDYILKFVYLVFTLCTYLGLGSFYSTDIADYRSRFQPALDSSDPAFVAQCNLECSTLCSNFINLAKSAWLIAMLGVVVAFYVFVWLFDSPTGNLLDSQCGKCANSPRNEGRGNLGNGNAVNRSLLQ
jgi:hypothetical protein